MKRNTFLLIKNIVLCLDPSVRIYAFATLLLIVISAFADAISVGSVIPFLNILLSPADSDQFTSIPLFHYFNAIFNNLPESRKLIYAGFGFILLAGFSSFIKLISLIANSFLSSKITSCIASQAFNSLYAQSYESIIAYEKAHLVNLLNTSVDYTYRIVNNCTTLIANLMLSVVIFLLLFVVKPYESSLVVTFVIIFYFVITFLLRPYFIRFSKISLALINDKHLLSNAALYGLRDVFLGSRQSLIAQTYSELENSIRSYSALTQIFSQSPKSLIEFAALSAIILISLISVLNGSESSAGLIGTLAFFAFGAQRFLPASQRVYSSWSNIKNNHQHLFNLLDLINTTNNQIIIDSEQSLASLSFGHIYSNSFFAIGLENVKFSYSSSSPRLFSFPKVSFSKKQYTLITGISGSGKSTLLDLLAGLLHSPCGQVLINGISYPLASPVHKQFVSDNFYYISQSVYISNGTILDNICLHSRLSPDLSLAYESLRQAELLDFVHSLPSGIHTPLTSSTSSLSGGQQQRLALARAFYCKKDILILDEATSALDQETEHSILNTICRLKSSGLCIIHVSHKLDTRHFADQILTIRDGKIVSSSLQST